MTSITSSIDPTVLWAVDPSKTPSVSRSNNDSTSRIRSKYHEDDTTNETPMETEFESLTVNDRDDPIDSDDERGDEVAVAAGGKVELLQENPFFQDLGVLSTSYSVDGHHESAARRESVDSLSSLLQKHCQTFIGKKQLKFLLKNPYDEADTLNEQLNHVKLWVENRDILETLQPMLRRILPITRAFHRLSKPAHPMMQDWRSIIQTLDAVEDFRAALGMDGKLRFYKEKIDANFDESITAFKDTLVSAIDIQDSIANSKFIVKPGFSVEIDHQRMQMQEIDAYLETAAHAIKCFWNEQGFGQSTNYCIGYLEDVGFLIMLPTQDPGVAHVAFNLDRIMRRAFVTENFVCYRHEYLDELDNHYHKPRARVDSISWDIHESFRVEFLNLAEPINHVIDCIGSLDVLMALASAAIQYSWKRPVITTDRFKITRGAHPTLELKSDKFVKNDFNGDRAVTIITGANNSGKSVFVSQVALIAHLAMCGSFVPAESAQIPMIDKVLAVCKSIHTTTNDTSLFASDVKKLRYAIDNTTSRSLVMIDEFGKSTRPEDGMALLLSVINSFLHMKPRPPFTLVVTHFHSIASLLPRNEMNVHYLESRILNGTEYSYSFKEGQAVSSLASLVYKKAGLDPSVADRAKEIEDTLRTRGTLATHCDEQQSEQLRKARKLVEKFLKVDDRSYMAIRKFFSEIKEQIP